MDQVSKNIAEILLRNKAVMLSPDKPFTYASGIKSPIYCDNRVLISSVADRRVVVEAFVAKLQGVEFDVVAGTATAGIAWAAWIAEKLNKPLIYVRSSSKQHGRQNAIEGSAAQGSRMVVIEDLISTGGSSLQVVELLREAGHDVKQLFAIFSYEMKSAGENFNKNHVTATALTSFSNLIEVAKSRRDISDLESTKLLQWQKSPETWAKENGFV